MFSLEKNIQRFNFIFKEWRKLGFHSKLQKESEVHLFLKGCEMRTEWNQQIRKRQGQHHFYRNLWKLLGSSYLTCGLRSTVVLAIPSRAFSPVLLSPKHSQGKGTESHPTGLQRSLTPLPKVVILISLLLLQSQPHQWLPSLGPSLCFTPVTNARIKAQALTLHMSSLWSPSACKYPVHTSNLASFTCSLDSGTDVYASNSNYDNT